MRASIPDVIDVETNSDFLRILRNLYKSIILTDLDFALDKKVEHDLWNICFKVPISRLKSKRDRKNSFLNWFVEGVSGFYLVLLQEISSQCDTDTTLCKRNFQLGIFNSPTYIVKPKNESFLYICQHCLIHLGDLSRYRNLMDGAEGYYKQAVLVEPSSGHPYNQLALLETVRGDKLSTLFYYARSLALKHPFPPAKINLEKLFKQLIKNNPKSQRGGRLTAEECLLSFLKLQGQIGLHYDFESAEETLTLLAKTWPSLVATEALTPSKLIRMLTITLYLAGECSGQKRNLQLAIDVASSVLNGCLAACCSIPEEQLSTSAYLPVIKLVLDWFRTQPEVIRKVKGAQIWSLTANLLNQLQICFKEGPTEDDGKPLPEDVELLEFTPIRPVTRWPSTEITQSDAHRVRAARMVQQGRWLADKPTCLAVTHQSDGLPEWFFSSLKSNSPIEKEIENLSILKIDSSPKNIKIQTPQVQTTILKHSDDDESRKQETFQLAKAPTNVSYPGPPLPPRQELFKTEKERHQLSSNLGASSGLYSSFGTSIALPNLSFLPRSVHPPGLGFPPPAADWFDKLPPSKIVPPYSSFNSSNILNPGQLHSNFPANLAQLDQRVIQQLDPSLWSGPGTSPLERLLEQQKATRSGISPSNK